MEFSPESRLLIANWNAVQDIIAAKRDLDAGTAEYLRSLGQSVSALDWWNDGWMFKRYDNYQVYISREEWQENGDSLIGIGVEDVTPDSLWGTEEAATLYVYVWKQRYDIAQSLGDVLKGQGPLVGEIQERASTGYVVKAQLMKCLPQEIDSFDEKIGKQILDFFACYARFADQFTQALKKCSKGKPRK